MALNGYIFDKSIQPAAADRSLLNYLSLGRSGVIPDRGSDVEVTTNGLDLIIGTGQLLVQGSLIEITAPIVLQVPTNDEGFLVVEIDLTKINSSTGQVGSGDYECTINQIDVLLSPTVTQQDLHNGGTLYQLPLGAYSSTNAAVTFLREESTYSPIALLPNGVDLGNSYIQNNQWVSKDDNLIGIYTANDQPFIIADRDDPNPINQILMYPHWLEEDRTFTDTDVVQSVSRARFFRKGDMVRLSIAIAWDHLKAIDSVNFTQMHLNAPPPAWAFTQFHDVVAGLETQSSIGLVFAPNDPANTGIRFISRNMTTTSATANVVYHFTVCYNV